MKKQNLVTLSQYLILLRSLKIKSSHQNLHNRRKNNELEFCVGGNTPEFKIDINKYPPEKYKVGKAGRKKTQ
jgi:hypothetical protein